jgi:hypothetical protein
MLFFMYADRRYDHEPIVDVPGVMLDPFHEPTVIPATRSARSVADKSCHTSTVPLEDKTRIAVESQRNVNCMFVNVPLRCGADVSNKVDPAYKLTVLPTASATALNW